MKFIYGLFLCLAVVTNNFALSNDFRTAKISKSNREISGTITDHNNRFIADIKVKAINTATKKHYQTKTDASGFYKLSNLPLGSYSIRFEGTKEFKSKTVKLELGLNGDTVYNTVLDSR